MSDHIDTLKKLHTRLIDSRNGYQESRKEVSDEAAFVGFFDRRIAERERFHTELHQQLGKEGVDVSESGSAAATAHRGWLKLRDAITGDDEAVYDEIINGETALLENYDDAIKATAGHAGYGFLSQQRADVQRAIDEAKAEKARHAAT
ncbi:PA2169 family four-helix-bundle protein [Marinovum sp.]|uniref:PA2169 family four-helix-bundle protein n=1 Tax=Marinovum sp. TaxID=2024839 RepID=UPI002B272E5A|nr:PA2169 family four-helix-bundle protein [Marinovum sp.]